MTELKEVGKPQAVYMVTFKQEQQLKNVARAADRLESWLGQNAGTSADWLVEIIAHGEDSRDALAQLLQDLKDALTPLRK